MGQLDSRRAIITGGGSGIGYAIAARFHAEGAFVTIAGRREQKLAAAAAEIAADGERMLCVRADVTVEDDIKHLLASAAAKMGGIDILVNNAGAMRFGPLHEAAQSDWDLMLRTNVWGPWRLMVHVLPYMREAGGGAIICISSISGIKPFPGAGLYCMSKAALQMLSQTVAMENAADQIRVNCILPALVEDTELADSCVGPENVQALWAKLRPLHPMGRSGKPADIADAALFLASEQSAWITGLLMNVDGGRHMVTNRPAE
jgi:3-oxoacyl-[acyl-carrier protein] reductase